MYPQNKWITILNDYLIIQVFLQMHIQQKDILNESIEQNSLYCQSDQPDESIVREQIDH